MFHRLSLKKKIYNLHSTFKSSTSLKQFSQNAGKWDYLIVFINLEKSHLYRIQLSKRGLVPVCILKADEAKSLNQELFLFSLCITLHCCLVILCPFRPSCLSCRDSTQFYSFHTIPTFSKSHEILNTVYWVFQHSWSVRIFTRWNMLISHIHKSFICLTRNFTLLKVEIAFNFLKPSKVNKALGNLYDLDFSYNKKMKDNSICNYMQ